MSHQPLRLITANAYEGRAVRDPESMEALLPHDGIPTVTAFQETLDARDNTSDVIRDNGYHAILLGSHGLTFAVSPDIPVYDIQEVTYPSRRTGRRWGLHVIKFTVYRRDVTFGAGQGPVFCSSGWPFLPYRDAETFGAYAEEDPDALLVGAGDRNFMTVEQKEAYHREQQKWGAYSLVPETEATYRLREGKHRWLSWFGVQDPQLDGISVRPPNGMELVLDTGEELEANQIGYKTKTKVIASDHKAVETEFSIPPATKPSKEQGPAIDLTKLATLPKEETVTKFTRARHRIQRSCYRLLYLDDWLWDHRTPVRLPRLQRPFRWLALSSARFWCTTIRNRAGGANPASPKEPQESAS